MFSQPLIVLIASMFIPALTLLQQNSQTRSWPNLDAVMTVETSSPERPFLFHLLFLPSRHSERRHATIATWSTKSQHGLIRVISRGIVPGLQAFLRTLKNMAAHIIIELNNS